MSQSLEHNTEQRVFKKIHKRQVCRFWLKDSCAKGDGCEWLHANDPEAMPPCSYDPNCTKAGCPYKHGVTVQKNPCANYQAGFCSFGNLCKDSHEWKDQPPPLVSAVFLSQDVCKDVVKSRYSTQKSFRKAVCPYFKSDGWCPYFYACAFQHEK
jgi:hypothetical protein